MTKVKMIAEKIHAMPWEDKPAGLDAPVWRHSQNPIIKRNPAKGIARIFNSAVVSHNDEFIGVFRAETIDGRPHLHLGKSQDGLNWDIEEEKIPFVDEEGNSFQPPSAY